MNKRNTALTAFFMLGALALAGCASGTSARVSPPDAPAASDAPMVEEATATPEGTRENPYPLGSTVSSADWTVVVNSVTLNATEAVMAANPFNEAPDEGSEYIVINYTVTYTGDDADGQMAAFVGLEYVTASGTTVNELDKFVVSPDPKIDTLSTLYNGGSVSGNTAMQVPSPADGVLAVRPGMFADKAFVAIQ